MYICMGDCIHPATYNTAIMVAIATLLPDCSYSNGTFTVLVSALNAALLNDMSASDNA
jgi:hypothetical protein